MVRFVFGVEELCLEREVVGGEHQCRAGEENGIPDVAKRALHDFVSAMCSRTGKRTGRRTGWLKILMGVEKGKPCTDKESHFEFRLLSKSP